MIESLRGSYGEFSCVGPRDDVQYTVLTLKRIIILHSRVHEKFFIRLKLSLWVLVRIILVFKCWETDCINLLQEICGGSLK